MPSVKLDWNPPLALLKEESSLQREPGVYVFCVRRRGRYFAHYVGKSKTSVHQRVVRHISEYRKGNYWLHDLNETVKENRLGRPLYNPRNRQLCFDPRTKQLAEDWLSEFRVFAGVRCNPPVPLQDIEGALAWQFRRDPRQPFTRFCDMYHQVKQKGVSQISLVHTFGSRRIEEL